MPLYQPSSSASAITIKDEGSALSTAASSIDFVGAGVTASGTTADKTITIPGGSNQRASIAAASAAIANTETVVVSTSLAANYLTAGMSFRIRAAGVGTTGAAAGADTFRIRIGTTTLTGNIVTSVAPTANDSVTAQAFGFEAIITCRTAGATGTIIGECQALGDNASTGLFTTLNDLSATTATVAVDTTATNLLELTFQSGSAGSSCTFHTATIEVLSSGSTNADAGTVFPSAPSTNQRFYRTDLALEFYYNGTRWLCTCPHTVSVSTQHALLTMSATNSVRAPAPSAITATIWLTTLDVGMYVATTNNGTNYWTVAFGATSVSTASSAADTVLALTANINAVFTIATDKWFQVDITKVGAPGVSYPMAGIGFRYIGT